MKRRHQRLIAALGLLGAIGCGGPEDLPSGRAQISSRYWLGAPCVGSFLIEGQGLTSGQCLSSPSGSFRLELQASDGNVVLYDQRTPPGTAIWWSGTNFPNPAQTGLLFDFNIVTSRFRIMVFNGALTKVFGYNLFKCEMRGTLRLDDDGILGIYCGDELLYRVEMQWRENRIVKDPLTGPILLGPQPESEAEKVSWLNRYTGNMGHNMTDNWVYQKGSNSPSSRFSQCKVANQHQLSYQYQISRDATEYCRLTDQIVLQMYEDKLFGNCGERAPLAFCRAWELGFRVTLCQRIKGDHLFLLFSLADGTLCGAHGWNTQGDVTCGLIIGEGGKLYHQDGMRPYLTGRKQESCDVLGWRQKPPPKIPPQPPAMPTAGVAYGQCAEFGSPIKCNGMDAIVAGTSDIDRAMDDIPGCSPNVIRAAFATSYERVPRRLDGGLYANYFRNYEVAALHIQEGNVEVCRRISEDNRTFCCYGGSGPRDLSEFIPQ